MLALEHEAHHLHSDLIGEISRTSLADILSGSIVDENTALVSQAGLLMIAGSWDGAHDIVQELDMPEARFWHGILHRREPDTSNARYWFRQVPTHPVFTRLVEPSIKEQLTSWSLYADLVQGEQWNPDGFARLCHAYREGQLSHRSQAELQGLQYQECLTLLEFCREKAIGLSGNVERNKES